MANVPPNNPNVDASAIVPALVNPDHAPTQLVGLGNGFAPYWIGGNIPDNQNGWIEEDAEEEEEDPEEDLEEDPKEDPERDDDVMEMDDEAEVIDPSMDDGSNNPPPPNFKDEETPPTSPVIPDANGHPIPHIASFGQNFHFEFGEYMCRMLQNRQKSEGSSPLPLGSQVREPPAKPSARLVLAPYLDDPYVVTRDGNIVDAAIATFGINDDDDETSPMDS
nr:hypothetical protein [Tanacetum cinerariifolium]